MGPLSIVSQERLWEEGGREGCCAFKIVLKMIMPAPTSGAALDSLLRASRQLKVSFQIGRGGRLRSQGQGK